MKQATPQINRKIVQDFNNSRALPAGFTIRLCGETDIEAIYALGQACFDYNAPTLPEIAYAIRKTHGGVFGLYDEGQARFAGYMLLEAHAGRKNLYINTTTLLKEYRGRGLGQALYDFKDFYTRKLHAKNIWCHVAVNNDVNIHLMEKNGYARERQEDDYYEDGRSALIMRKANPAAGK